MNFFATYGILVPHEEKNLGQCPTPPSPFSPPPLLLVGAEFCDEQGKTNTFLGLEPQQKIEEYIFVT